MIERQGLIALSPMPQCLLQEDLAFLYARAQDYVTADQLFSTAKMGCPEQVNGRYGDQDLFTIIAHGLIDLYQRDGNMQDARQVAAQLLTLNPKDDKALQTLTAVNLLQTFQDGAAQINAAPDVEPIQIRQFTMPHNGDWGDILFTHPPNSISFQIDLPDEPTTFHSRIAMAPESWEWGGDGVTFVVSVEVKGALPTTLLRQHIGNDAVDRDWHMVDVPLTDYAGQTITLTLLSEPGPNNDSTGDWAGWETPRILVQP